MTSERVPPYMTECERAFQEGYRVGRLVTDGMIERAAEEMVTWSGPVPGDVPGFRPFAARLLRAALEVTDA